jgi:hypothetical protein
MNRKTLIILAVFSISSIILSGVLIQQGRQIVNQSFVLKFEYAGRFDVVMTHHGVSETATRLGLHEVYVSRIVGEPWEISFFTYKHDNDAIPMYLNIKTVQGELIHRSVILSRESSIDIDCINECNVNTYTDP